MIKNYNLGISLKLTNLFIFTSASFLFFSLDISLPAFQVFFLMATLSLIIMLPWLIYVEEGKLRVKSYKLYVYRALFNIAGTASWLEAINLLSFETAYVIEYLTPIITIILAILFCNERLNFKFLICLSINIIAIYIIVGQGALNSVFTDGTIIALFASIMWACYDIICKTQSKNEDMITQAFFTFFFTVIISMPIAMYIWQPITYSQLPVIMMISILCVANVIVLFTAYKHAPVLVLMPFSFIKALLMAFLMYFFFGENIEERTILGIALISLSLLYFFYQQHKGKLNI